MLCPDREIGVHAYEIGLSAGGVLIYGDDFTVCQDRLCIFAHIAYITAYHKRRIHKRPYRIMRAVFLYRAAAQTDVAVAVHADYKHVHIVEAAVSVVWLELKLDIVKLLYGLPVIEYVARGAPHLRTGGFYPFMRVVPAPAARGKKYVSSAVGQCKSHSLVEHMAGDIHGFVAIVVFKEVDAPGCKGFRVDKLIAERGRIARTGVYTGTGIHSELKSL